MEDRADFKGRRVRIFFFLLLLSSCSMGGDRIGCFDTRDGETFFISSADLRDILGVDSSVSVMDEDGKRRVFDGFSRLFVQCGPVD
jgi:hypothetical protein